MNVCMSFCVCLALRGIYDFFSHIHFIIWANYNKVRSAQRLPGREETKRNGA